MAGTRLLVHAVFLVQIFVMALVAFLVGSIHPDHVGFGGGPVGMFVDRRGMEHVPAAERALEGAERMGRCSRDDGGGEEGVDGGTVDGGGGTKKGKVLLRLWDVSPASSSSEEECSASSPGDSCPSSSTYSSEESMRSVWESINASYERRIKSGKRAIAASLDSADERTRLGRRLAEMSSSSSSASSSCDDLIPRDVSKLGAPEGWRSRHDYDEFSVDYRDEVEPYEVLVAWGCTQKSMAGGKAEGGIRIEVDGETGAALVKVFGPPPPPGGAENGEQVNLIVDAVEGLVDSVHLASSPLDAADPSLVPPLSSACQVRVTAIDEDPSSWGKMNSSPRTHHASVGRALRSSYDATLRPLLDAINAYGVAGDWSANLRTAAYGSLSAGCRTIGGSGGGFVANPKRVEVFAREHDEILSDPRRFGGAGGGGGTAEECNIDLVVYVPSRTNAPLRVKDGGNGGGAYGSAFKVTDEWGGEVAVAIANPTVVGNATLGEDDDDDAREVIEYDEAVREAMSYLSAVVAKRAGFPLSSSTASPSTVPIPARSGRSVPATVHPPPSGTMSRSMRDALLESRRSALFSAALSDLRTALHVAQTHQRTGLPRSSGRRLLECAELLLSASSSRNGPSASSLRDLERAAKLAREALEDGNAAEEYLYFPREHYVAVFSPLILPLVLPLLVGLGREWKRYKKLTSGEEGGANEVTEGDGADKESG